MRKVVVGLLAAWAAVAVELVLVVAFHRAELTTAWEVAMGTLWLAPTALLVLVPLGAAGAALGDALGRVSTVSRGLVTVAVALGAGVATTFVTTGRHFAAYGTRAGTVALVMAGAAALTWAAVPPLSRAFRDRPVRFAWAAIAVGVGFEIANQILLVRLYPAFHTALAVATVVAAALAGIAFERPGSKWRRRPVTAPLVLLSVLAAAALLVTPAAVRLSHFDNYRLVLAEHAPLLGHAVRLSAVLAPPPPLDDVAVDPDPQSDAALEGPSFAGRDIVLLTIDALRADHLGTYGYARATTPRMDALARESVVFEHAYCPTPHTSYSVTSLMTGKYMRPLLLQGAGQDSETLATFLRTYGYKTAAFYPPAVFFIDQSRFVPFETTHFGFEYRKVEFLEGEGRVHQVEAYLGRRTTEQRLFLWVHLFGPHEPYEAHAAHPFGDRDIDRYDSEIADADETVGGIVEAVRRVRPNAVVIVTADHGEEFGDHGGRYHGTTVYEEQVRVPLLLSAPGLVAPRRVREVVQTIDILPTLLASLSIPPSPRIRGRNLGPLLGGRAEQPGFAFVETDDEEVLAEGPSRLFCARKLGACRLYDIDKDPGEHEDLAPMDHERFDRMRAELRALGASQGRFERDGLRAETGKGWPSPILRGLGGDADAAGDLATLLDDSDRDIRRKAAELLFKLRRPESVPALRLALGRDEDPVVRRWCALALTRLGETVPLTIDVYQDPDPTWKRLAALVLAEAGDGRGQGILIDWWQRGARDDYEQALDLLAAFARVRSKDAVWPLVQSLGNVRLRPHIAETLAAIGDDTARGPLVLALEAERYQTARVAIADALVALGAKEELARPLIRFLGVPDPLPGGVGYAIRAGVLGSIGGPDAKTLAALAEQGSLGVRVRVVVPRTGNGNGVRVIVRARATGRAGEVRVGRSLNPLEYDSKGIILNSREAPRINDRDFVELNVAEAAGADVEVSATLPPSLGLQAGRAADLVVFAEPNVRIKGIVLVPLSDELPPPPPVPWSPSEGDDTR